MERILVLGCGLVGKTIALDLSKDYPILVVDINEKRLSEISNLDNIETKSIDLSNVENLKNLAKDFEYVVSAVPGFMGYSTIKVLLELGKKIVDISFFPEDPFSLSDLAKWNKALVVVDCGIAPGFSNMIVGNYYKHMQVNQVTIFVGGLPYARHLPYEYKAPFSPIDVLEEYIRPARVKHSGKIIERRALSDIELVDFDGIGTLEAFLTDGARTLLRTLDIPNIKEKTLRYPGYAGKIKLLIESGFLSSTPIYTKGGWISPLELTSALLLPKWKLSPNDQEFTILKIIIEGVTDSIPTKVEYLLFDKTDEITKDFSMGRTTGFTANAIMNLLLNERINSVGVLTPEEVAFDDANFEFVVEYLSKRKISIRKKEVKDGIHF